MLRINSQRISPVMTGLVAVLAIQAWAVSAEPFRNLDFDQANTNTTEFFHPSDPSLPYLEGVGPPEDLVPGWQLLVGTNPVSFVGWNLARTNVSWFTVISKDLIPNRVEGFYALQLHLILTSNPEGISFQQRGDIPPDAKTISFRHESEYLVTVDGNRLFPPDPKPSQTPGFTTLDISAFAGKNVKLSFNLIGEFGEIDSISFANTTSQSLKITQFVPDPSGNNMILAWNAATGPYLLQKRFSLVDTNWINVVTTPNTTTAVPRVGEASFFRIIDQATNNVLQLLVSLQGEAQQPDPVVTNAKGFGGISIDGNVMTYTINFSDLSGPVTAAHIHGPSDAVHNADVIIGLNFVGATSGTFSGILDVSALSADQVNAIRFGNAYVNIHTAAHPDGEIRGQLVP